MSLLQALPSVFRRLPTLATDNEWSLIRTPLAILAIPKQHAQHATKTGTWAPTLNLATPGRRTSVAIDYKRQRMHLGTYSSEADANFARTMAYRLLEHTLPLAADPAESIRHAVGLHQQTVSMQKDSGKVSEVKTLEGLRYRARVVHYGKSKYGPMHTDFDSAYNDLEVIRRRWDQEFADQVVLLNVEYLESVIAAREKTLP